MTKKQLAPLALAVQIHSVEFSNAIVVGTELTTWKAMGFFDFFWVISIMVLVKRSLADSPPTG